MPNHVINVLKFKNLKPKDVDTIINLIATPIHEGTTKPSYAIDFDKIIPEPRTAEECDPIYVFSDEQIESGHTGVQCTDDRNWFNWYEWRVDNWGTKWGAYDCYSEQGKSYITFVFNTAWSIAYPVMQKLELLGYDLELRYADEDWGSNCGILSYSREQGWTHQDESDLKDSYKFAKNLWDRY